MNHPYFQIIFKLCFKEFYLFADETSRSSSVRAVIITAPILAVLLIVIGALYGFHRRKMVNKYRAKLLSPFKEVDYGEYLKYFPNVITDILHFPARIIRPV